MFQLIFFLEPDPPDAQGAFLFHRDLGCREPEEVAVRRLEHCILIVIYDFHLDQAVLILQLGSRDGPLRNLEFCAFDLLDHAFCRGKKEP